MPNRALVVDANILVRAVLGTRVRQVIETYAGSVSFFVPETAYSEAEEHLTTLVVRRGGHPEKALALLRSLGGLVDLIGAEVYGAFEMEARERLGPRDPEDWPILASALALGCPIWTEDTDFFGCGVATWTSNRVQMVREGIAASNGRSVFAWDLEPGLHVPFTSGCGGAESSGNLLSLWAQRKGGCASCKALRYSPKAASSRS